MIMQFNQFHDNLNLKVILAHSCELFSAKGVQFLLIFAKLN